MSVAFVFVTALVSYEMGRPRQSAVALTVCLTLLAVCVPDFACSVCAPDFACSVCVHDFSCGVCS